MSMYCFFINVSKVYYNFCCRDQTFEPCAKVINVEAFISRCLETACSCLESANGSSILEDNCRCQTLSNFVVDCLTADNELELLDWRSQHDCRVYFFLYSSFLQVLNGCYKKKTTIGVSY